jgi:hypothetical protein
MIGAAIPGAYKWGKRKMTTLTKNQKKSFTTTFMEDGKPHVIKAEVRFDDECGNGHNTFSITADIFRGATWVSGGCQHDEIAKHFPHLVPFLKWHLCSTDGPMHYVANTIHLAGDRDCWGLRKGEFQPLLDKETGLPKWTLEKHENYITSAEEPAPVRYVQWGRTGEGKERELDAARRAAIWPDATDEELMADDLRDRLLARLPQLMEEFRRDVESLGFTY